MHYELLALAALPSALATVFEYTAPAVALERVQALDCELPEKYSVRNFVGVTNNMGKSLASYKFVYEDMTSGLTTNCKFDSSSVGVAASGNTTARRYACDNEDVQYLWNDNKRQLYMVERICPDAFGNAAYEVSGGTNVGLACSASTGGCRANGTALTSMFTAFDPVMASTVHKRDTEIAELKSNSTMQRRSNMTLEAERAQMHKRNNATLDRRGNMTLEAEEAFMHKRGNATLGRRSNLTSESMQDLIHKRSNTTVLDSQGQVFKRANTTAEKRSNMTVLDFKNQAFKRSNTTTGRRSIASLLDIHSLVQKRSNATIARRSNMTSADLEDMVEKRSNTTIARRSNSTLVDIQNFIQKRSNETIARRSNRTLVDIQNFVQRRSNATMTRRSNLSLYEVEDFVHKRDTPNGKRANLTEAVKTFVNKRGNMTLDAMHA